jgi:DNA-binding NarL/FixJ family response regulator
MIHGMTPKKSLLLAGTGANYEWVQLLKSALLLLDMELISVSKLELDEKLLSDSDLVILDAGTVSDLAVTISRLIKQNPKMRIVVFSSWPDWKQAREAMLAGAIYYSPKILDQRHIFTTLKTVLTSQI